MIAAADSRPLQGVTIVLSLSSAAAGDAGASNTATTDATGKFSFPNLPIGAYTLAFARTGFTAKSVAVGNAVGTPTVLAVTLASDTTPGVDAPTFQVSVLSGSTAIDPFAVGYGTPVTVQLTNIGDTAETAYDASSFSYKWTLSTAVTSTNATGAYSFTTPPTSSSTSASFNTMTLQQTKGVEVYPYNAIDGGPLGHFARLGVVGINPDETGRYTVGITISDPEGHNYAFSQPIQSTWQTASVADVPIGVPVYVQGDTYAGPNWLQQSGSFWKWPNTSWSWSFASCTDDKNVAITCPTLADATTQFPHFVPAANGVYTLTVTESSSFANAGTTGLGLDAGPGPGGSYGTQTSNLVVFAGNWIGVMNGNPAASQCTTCHAGTIAPDKFSPWANTSHASAMQRKVDGLATSHFGESCLECHTLGWSETESSQTAANGGFYYEMNTETGPDGGLWQYPNPMTPTSYSTMVTNYPTLGYLGGIQCENCHGPAGGPAGGATGVEGHPGDTKGDVAQKKFLAARVSFNEQVCASCHQEATNHVFPSQWSGTGHNNVQVAIQRASVESKSTAMGGGNDPQGGAQFCARCHSGQGFAEYVEMLKNGATGRYDFITTDNQKLAADGGNAPTVPYLASLGLTASQVESQTCQTCHDPHSNGAYSAAYGSDAGIGPVDCTQQGNNANPACMQLRIYDQLPYGLPNGIGPISGVGEGALCMACHNGRNGEHTDTNNSSPYAETPHDSTATEALFGFNAFFVPRYSPSPHLAIQDTCAGCHVKLPTSSEVAAGQTSNHAFATDNSICQNCHGSAAVDGAALQAQVANEMATLQTAIINAVTGGITTANTAGGLCVQVGSISDPLCTGGSCKSSIVPTAVPFPVPPSNVWIPASGIASVTMSNGGTTTVTINTKAGIAIPYFDPKTMAAIGTTKSTTTKLSVAIYTILTGVTSTSCVSGGVSTGGVVGTPANQLFPASNPSNVTPDPSIPSKAIWNYVSLSNEGSGGIHNYPWTNAVIQATLTQIGAWKP